MDHDRVFSPIAEVIRVPDLADDVKQNLIGIFAFYILHIYSGFDIFFVYR